MNKYIGIGIIAAVIGLGSWYFFAPQSPVTSDGMTAETVTANIAGHWQSTQDTLYETVFTADGVAEEWYDGALLQSGTWAIGSASETGIATEEYNPTGVFLVTLFGEGTYAYAVLTANETQLTLSYLDRGNTLDFIRLADNKENRVSSGEDTETYTNSEYGFSLTHPVTWEVQEALKPQDITALHEISIHEKEYDMWRGEVSVDVFANNAEQSVRKWWQTRLAQSDEEDQACVAEYKDQAPCFFLKDMVRKVENTTFANRDAVYVELFQFDHTEGCTYVAHDEYIIGLCAVAGVNPNDPQAEAHQDIAESLFASMVFN